MSKPRLLGGEELSKRFQALEEALTKADAAAVVRTAGVEVRDAIRKRAPRAKARVFYTRIRFTGKEAKRKRQQYGVGARSSEPGSLRKAIRSYAGVSKRQKHVYSWVKVNYKSRYGPAAPHGHLVEFGSKDRNPKNAKYMTFPNRRGGWVRTPRVKDVAARPYFKPGMEAAGPAAIEKATAKYQRIVKRVAEKGF